MRPILLAAVVATLPSFANAAVTFTAVTKVSLNSTSNAANPEYVGSNPNTVAWDGTNAWIGGYNASGLAADVKIVQVSNVLTTPTLGASFGAINVGNGRGLTSLAVQGGNLAASLDTGAASGDSVRLFNAGAGTLTWRIGDAAAGNDSTRRGNGVSFDPGFNGAGTNQGVAYLSIGGGRRHLLNTTTGVYINGQNAGGVINFAPVSTVFRDVAFDTSTGDLYSRESNRVGKAVRTGDNTFATQVALGSFTATGTVDNENIAFIGGNLALGGNKYILANDRPATTSDPISSVLKLLTTSGAAETLGLNFDAVGGAPVLGNRAYDFSYDAGTNTLALVDFQNRDLYIFSITVPEPATLSVIAGAGLVALRRRRR